jgi:hypothetical protein
MRRSLLHAIVCVGSNNGRKLERSNNPRRFGKILRTVENFSTVVESCKNEFRIVLEQLLQVVWRRFYLKVLW